MWKKKTKVIKINEESINWIRILVNIVLVVNSDENMNKMLLLNAIQKFKENQDINCRI